MRYVLIWCAAVLALAPIDGMAQAPMEVMTDTAGYCAQLEARVAGVLANSSPPAEVQMLVETGHKMCLEGEIRGGIARLRRALVSLHGAHTDIPAKETNKAAPP